MIYCLILLLTQDGLAQSGDQNNSVSLDKCLVFLTDSTQNLTLDSIRTSSFQKRFSHQNKLSEQFPVWVKVRTPVNTPPGDYCVYSFIDETITLYMIRNDGVITRKNGRYVAPSERSVPENYHHICFTLTAQDSLFYLRVDPIDGYSPPLELHLSQEDQVLSSVESNTRMTLFSSGALLIIVLCSFTLFLFLHDASYALFCLYVICSYTMTHTVFLGYLLGDELPLLLLDDNILQVYFILAPLSLLWFSYVFFQIKHASATWSRIFIAWVVISVVCFVTIPFDATINSDIILVYNIGTVILVAIYSAISYFKHRFEPAYYFLIAFLVPIIVASLIVLNYTGVLEVSGLNLLAGVAFFVQSLILFIGVVKRYQKINANLMQVTFTKWQKEHEAKLFQLRNAELLSHNEIIQKQKMQLSDQARKQEEMNATKDKLLSVLSHDLRGPVGNLKSILSLLSNRQMSADEFYNLSQRLKQDVEGAYEMLEDVLHWVKSQQEGIVTHPVDFNLRSMTEEVARLALPSAEEKNIKIQVSGLTSPIVYADQDHAHIILRNLISNAVKFARTDTMIQCDVVSSPGFIQVNISDEGVGISAQDVQKILTDMKVNSTRGTRGEKGTGLGLLLCREFIRLNGGQFFLKSELGVGTTVSFTLPRVEE